MIKDLTCFLKSFSAEFKPTNRNNFHFNILCLHFKLLSRVSIHEKTLAINYRRKNTEDVASASRPLYQGCCLSCLNGATQYINHPFTHRMRIKRKPKPTFPTE